MTNQKMPPPTNNNSAASSASLGVTMALPPGASSRLESQRAEELRRRRHHRAQEQRKTETSSQLHPKPQPSSQPSTSDPPPPRRLAPGRKKATVSNVAKPLPPAVATRLPIDVSLGKERHEVSDVIECFEDERSNQDSAGNTPRNIADWTLRRDDHDNKQSPPISKIVEEDDEDDGSDDAEQEYHGEIQSTASTDHGDAESDDGDEDDEEPDDGGFKIITEEQISLNPPPPTKPLVLVNLGALCGCVPADQEEKAILENQLMESLLGPSTQRKAEDDGDGESPGEQPTKKGNLLGDGLSLDFDERVVELLESGVARHVDSSHPIAVSSSSGEGKEGATGAEVNPYAVVPYPEFLASAGGATRSTLRLWKLLHATPAVARPGDDNGGSEYSPLLSRVFSHLRDTSRSLLWKADMHRELSLLMRREHLARVERDRRKECNAWKEGVRRERLEKLYDVRETFTLQVGVAKKKYDKFVEEREGRVERELRRRGLHELRSAGPIKSEDPVGGSSSQNDDDGETIDYGDDGWGDATIREEDIVGERHFDTSAIEGHPEEDEDDDENDEWAPLDMKNNPLGMNITLDGIKTPSAASQGREPQHKKSSTIVITNKLEPISHDENLKRKSERLQKKQDQIASSAAAAAGKRTNGYFKQQQESIREMLKTNDERIAETTYLKLKERLQNVDDLLESLQEEEWAEEDDEDEGRGGGGADVEYDPEEELANGSTLLDQILAMILGGLPPKEGPGAGTIAAGREEEMEHYRYIREEHKSIVKEWLATFGRLPPFPSDEEPEMEPEPLDGDTPEPFGDGFSSSPQTKNCLASDHSDNLHLDRGVGKQIDLNPIGNDKNWDEVEDWDALFPQNC